MLTAFSVSLKSIINELSLNPLYMPKNPENINISSSDVNRPGLELTGFLDYFDKKRILIFGNTEIAFLSGFNSEGRFKALDNLFSLKPPCVIITRNIKPFDEIVKAAQKNEVPILIAQDTTSAVVATLVSYMNSELAPKIRRHGVLVEVYGEGILLIGDSGVGKSETAIELIKRGHRLIADDAVDIKRVSKDSLVGSAPENIRHFIELRGIGIINVQRIFGMGAVKLSETINMVINLENWDDSKVYDRTGLETSYTEILGIEVPILTIPVTPGRNLAVIIEVAAMNSRQKKLGYNAAQELMDSLGMDYDIPKPHKKSIESIE